MIIYERSGRTAVLRINRPQAMNALNEEVLAALDEALERSLADESVRAIVITGEGKAFVAGADIASMLPLDREGGHAFGRAGQEVFRKIETLSKPVIAAINGFALGGGCELAMACDIRIASERAKLGQPEVGLGITPGYSGTQRLPRLVGKAKALELLLTGQIIKAEEACAIGLVNRVVPGDDLMTEAVALAEKIGSNAPLAVSYCKEAVVRGLETADMEEAIQIEADLFARCFDSRDQKEGMSAFLEKRAPDFQGL